MVNKYKNQPGINWKKNSALSSETIESFAAKYCFLNHIKPANFYDTLYDLIGNYLKYGNIKVESLLKISEIFHEPLDIISSIFTNSYLYNCTPINRLLRFEVDHFKTLSYCPKCIKSGYHCKIHNCFWLKVCPIHNIKLCQINLYELHDNAKPFTYFSIKILTLTKLFMDNCKGWPFNKSNNLDLSNIYSIENWFYNCKKVYSQYETIKLELGVSPFRYPVDYFGFILNILNNLHEIPINIRDWMPHSNNTFKVNRKIFNFKNDLRLTFNGIKIKNIIVLYLFNLQKNNFLTNKKLHQFIHDQIINIEKIHQEKRCLWSNDNSYSNWFLLKNDLIHYNSIYQPCIFEYAIQNSKTTWLNPELKDLSYYRELITLCNETCIKLIDKNLAFYDKDNDNLYSFNTIQFSWEKEITHFFDHILMGMAECYFYSLTQWLQMMTNPKNQKGKFQSSNFMDFAMSQIYLKFNSDNSCEVMSIEGVDK
ncbi:hypothetical protein Q5M60_00400 [Acinetobacter baumannii]|nr:hypothetical protein [Acinetobacter baumannii]